MFGWSYPAGVSGTPYDDEPPIFCNTCGLPEGMWEEGKGNTFEMDDDTQLKEDGEQVAFCSHECRAKWYVPDTIHSYTELAEELGVDISSSKLLEDDISHRVYKATDCGASCSFIHEDGSRYTPFRLGIRLGSIVEGADYDTEYYDLWFPFTQAEFYNTLNNIEEEASFIWNETNDDGVII